jgi:demethylmenaquinone methyltransferase / 2-methoxy-6-polyprenyl-1,4-benzoquinol methylase
MALFKNKEGKMREQLLTPSRSEIWKMFDKISSTYDKTNRLMTMGLDLYWRKKVSFFLPEKEKLNLLDCATGTADQIISLMQHSTRIDKATGIDLSEEMVAIGKEKLKKTSFAKKAELQIASALEIPFPDSSFDCVTMSFGIRNVTSVETCLDEIFRVLNSKGRVLILETSMPKVCVIKALHLFYLRRILPFIGGWISKEKNAYTYLNKTTETFPSGNAFCELLEKTGFSVVQCHPMTFGSVSIYSADKP